MHENSINEKKILNCEGKVSFSQGNKELMGALEKDRSQVPIQGHISREIFTEIPPSP